MAGPSSNQPTFPSAPAPLCLPPHLNTAGPTFLYGLPKHPEGKPDRLLGTYSNNRDERGAACSRLVGCHSPRTWSKKKIRESNTEIFNVPAIFFCHAGPHKRAV